MQGWSRDFSQDDAVAFVAKAGRDQPGLAGSWHQFAIADPDDDRLLGDIGWYSDLAAGHARIGWTVHPRERGRGIAAEAAAAVIEFMRSVAEVRTLEADALADNVASMRVLQQLGFTRSPAPPKIIDVGGTEIAEIDYRLDPSAPARSPLVALLAGGRSTRMGADKARTQLDGRPMAHWVRDAAASAGLEVVVSGPDDAGTGCIHVPDSPDHPDALGPMVGLRSVMDANPDRPVILLATDQPLVAPATLLQLAMSTAATATIPFDDGHPQVTCARYDDRAAISRLPRLREVLDDPGTNVVSVEEWGLWGESGRSFWSLDTPEALARAEAAIRS